MILLTLLIILILFISFNNEKFELLGTNNDIWHIIKEDINQDVPCYLNNDTNITGYQTILTTRDNNSGNNKTVETCDFGIADDANSCDKLEFNCLNSNCTEEKVIPLLNINGEYRCRKVPYIY